MFRDAGGFAYHILRTDRVEERRRRVRVGLLALVDDSGTALGRVASALREHDAAQAEEPFVDESEGKSDPHDDVSTWPEILRAGVDRIVSRTETPSAKRVEQLLHWVPYCIARHELRLARYELGLNTEIMPVGRDQCTRIPAYTVTGGTQRVPLEHCCCTNSRCVSTPVGSVRRGATAVGAIHTGQRTIRQVRPSVLHGDACSRWRPERDRRTPTLHLQGSDARGARRRDDRPGSRG